MNEPMDPFVAVFNLHVNQAGKKANQDVIKRYGRLKFQQVFPSLYRKGIMVMFKTPPIRMTQFWVDRVTYYVNQKEAPCDTSTPSI